MANPLSNPVKPETTGATMGLGAAAGAAGFAVVAGVVRAGAGAGAGAAGAGALEGAGAAATGAAAEAPEGGGVPGAKVGSLIVGAEVGFGGKLMRTVSFLGWTLEASAGLGGNAPPGGVGMLSAISFLLLLQPKVASLYCQTRILLHSALISS
jgi:hypothetical protein